MSTQPVARWRNDLDPPGDEVRNLAVLGATGSIGGGVLDIVRRFPDRFRVLALAARSNVQRILDWFDVCRPAHVVMTDTEAASALADQVRRRCPGAEVEIHAGRESLIELVTLPEVDTVVSAMVGAAGLDPTYEALRHGKRVCLANKESLVIGGALFRAIPDHQRGTLIPVDSEHSALFQTLVGESRNAVRRLWLTASGGPFLHRDPKTFAAITPEEALRHPNWKMGPKITVDSATLINKGLEVIEAHFLFDWPVRDIEVVIHPQSIVHSMVEFIDGSFKAQLSTPDMRLPILYALTYPRRYPLDIPPWRPWQQEKLEFFPPDLNRFPCLKLAREAVEAGPTYPIVLNAANEVAVQAFLDTRLPFTGIPEVIRAALEAHRPEPLTDLEDVRRLDEAARRFSRRWIGTHT